MSSQRNMVFIHTGEVHKANFESLVRKYDQEIGIHHVVNEQMLSDALKTGKPSNEAFKKAVQQAQQSNPDVIICTCSTFGDLSDQSGVVERIDRPVVEYMVNRYSKIGLAYTAKSTWNSSSRLVESEAHKLNKTVELVPIDCSEFWDCFLNGDTEAYAQGIADLVTEKAESLQVVFLAQASMSAAQERIHSPLFEVLTSPEIGVEQFLKTVRPL